MSSQSVQGIHETRYQILLIVQVYPFTLPQDTFAIMDDYDAQAAADKKRSRSFRKYSYRGHELDKLLDMSNEEFMQIVHARVRRRFQRGLNRKPMGLIKKLRKAKAEAPPNEKPAPVKTHLRDMIVVPEMIGSVISIYNGKVFNTIEVKPEMTGHYLAEFSMSYIPTRHGKPGLGSTNSSRFIPLK
ncbi:unnamed protein product [Sympodiomycopsis kandeliae]